MTSERRHLSPGRLTLLGGALLSAGLAVLAGAVGDAFAEPEKLRFAAIALWVLAGLLGLWLIEFRRIDALFDDLVAFARLNRALPLRRIAEAGRLERGLIAAFLASAALLTLIPLFDKPLAALLADEENVVETLTALFYLIATAAVVRAAILARGKPWLRVNLAGLASMFFFVGMEEISWGQKLMPIATPDALDRINIQGELTLHNIWSISLFQYPALAITAMLLCVLPLAHARSARWRDLMDAIQFPVAPPVTARLYFTALLSYFVIGFSMGSPTPLPFTYGDFIPSVDDEYLEFYLSFLFLVSSLGGFRIAKQPR